MCALLLSHFAPSHLREGILYTVSAISCLCGIASQILGPTDKRILAALTFLLVADLTYSFTPASSVLAMNAQKITSELCYVSFQLSVLLILLKFAQGFWKKKWFQISVGISTLIFGYLDFKYALLPNLVEEKQVLFFAANTTLYSLFQILNLGLASVLMLLAPVRVLSFFFYGIILINVSDIAIRFDLTNAQISTFSSLELGWQLGVMTLCAALVHSPKMISPASLKEAGLFHVRTIGSALIVVSNAVMILLVIAFNTPWLKNSSAVVLILIAFVVSLFVADTIIFHFKERLDRVVESIRTYRINMDSTEHLPPIQTPPMLFEFQEVIDSFNIAVLALNNALTRAKRAELASKVVHDIRAPLTALEIVGKSTTQLEPELQNLIIRAISRIREILQTLLAEKLSHDTEPFEVRPVLEEILKEKRLVAESLGKKIDVSLDPESENVPLQLACSKVEFKRSLSNLLDNSLESITDAGMVRVGLTTSDHKARISITDSGQGIPDDVIGQVGRPGYSYGKKGGNGLGLSGAIGFAQQWGGQVQIQSVMGKGTRVELRLPLPPV